MTLDTRAMLLATASEAEFQAAIVALARRLGYLVHAERPARTQHGWVTPIQGVAGWVDLALIHPERKVLHLWECKTQRGRPTPEQLAWLAALARCTSVDARLFRPSDWDTLTRVLEGLP